MQQLKQLFHSTIVTHARRTFLASLAGLAALGLAGSALFTPARAAGGAPAEDSDSHQLAKQAEVLQLLAGYHGALAYGGDLAAMAKLWAEDGSLTLNNGAPYIGKDAVLGFFAAGPYFSHNWVSLAPEWKTTITLHGNTAEATTECIATDVTVTPNVVRGVIQVNATCEKREGIWVFTRMNNFSLPEL